LKSDAHDASSDIIFKVLKWVARGGGAFEVVPVVPSAETRALVD
jgi:hypothetical protein